MRATGRRGVPGGRARRRPSWLPCVFRSPSLAWACVPARKGGGVPVWPSIRAVRHFFSPVSTLSASAVRPLLMVFCTAGVLSNQRCRPSKRGGAPGGGGYSGETTVCLGPGGVVRRGAADRPAGQHLPRVLECHLSARELCGRAPVPSVAPRCFRSAGEPPGSLPAWSRAPGEMDSPGLLLGTGAQGLREKVHTTLRGVLFFSTPRAFREMIQRLTSKLLEEVYMQSKRKGEGGTDPELEELDSRYARRRYYRLLQSPLCARRGAAVTNSSAGAAKRWSSSPAQPGPVSTWPACPVSLSLLAPACHSGSASAPAESW